MKTILVTGGAGYIGSHTCLLLLQRGYNVIVIDSFDNSSDKAIQKVLKIIKENNHAIKPNLHVFEGSLNNKEFIRSVFHKSQKLKLNIDGVIHFAGLKSVSESIRNPLPYWENNLIGTINLIDVIKSSNCKKFVFSSSATVYAYFENDILKENSKKEPSNPYGHTKLSIEYFLEDITKSSNIDLDVACLRYFNPIGAHSSGLIGESSKGIPNNIFPLISSTAISTNKILNIFGSDWPTKDGTPVRDYIHVMDLAEGHLKVLEYLFFSNDSFLQLNLGTGKGTSVLELVKLFEQVNNVKVPYMFVERRKGDYPYVVADNSFAISKINFIPKRSLKNMCEDEWKWRKLNPRGYF